MIVRSLLLDGQGFPYLSEYCYYYITGHCDRVVTCVTIDDTGENVKAIAEKVNYKYILVSLVDCTFHSLKKFPQLKEISTNEMLHSFKYKKELEELMVRSGCDFTMEALLCNGTWVLVFLTGIKATSYSTNYHAT